MRSVGAVLSISAGVLAAAFSAGPSSASEPVTLAHRTVSTHSTAAQLAFDEGLTALYAFNRDEAGRRFAEAARQDPTLAMAQWGIAMALGPNINVTPDRNELQRAAAALAHAKAPGMHADGLENSLIAAVSKRFHGAPAGDQTANARAYAGAMDALATAHPDDPDIATLAAESLMDLDPWSQWSKDGTPLPHTEHIVALLEGALAHAPDHIGANHFLIHATEASPHPEQARPSADRLRAVRVPDCDEHLVHMPAHVYFRIGDYAAAAASNEAAAAMSERCRALYGAAAGTYHEHDLAFLVTSYGMIGDEAGATGAARRAAQAGDVGMIISVRLRFGRWSEILAAQRPTTSGHMDDGMRGAPAVAMDTYARAVALAATGHKETASPAVAAGLGALQPIADATLAAHLAEARADRAGAIAHWRQAVAAEDAMGYGEPPAWFEPTREQLGFAQLASGDRDGAASTFRAALRQFPHDPRAAFGLARATGTPPDEAAVAMWRGPAAAVPPGSPVPPP